VASGALPGAGGRERDGRRHRPVAALPRRRSIAVAVQPRCAGRGDDARARPPGLAARRPLQGQLRTRSSTDPSVGGSSSHVDVRSRPATSTLYCHRITTSIGCARVGAGNPIRSDHAAALYSWISPPRTSRRWTRPRSVTGVGIGSRSGTQTVLSSTNVPWSYIGLTVDCWPPMHQSLLHRPVARVGDHPLIIERDPHLVQSDRPVIMHQQGDLLCRAPAARTAWKRPAQEVILASTPDGTHPPPRWIQAEKLRPRLRACWATRGAGGVSGAAGKPDRLGCHGR
jgi:hypothetical protein